MRFHIGQPSVTCMFTPLEVVTQHQLASFACDIIRTVVEILFLDSRHKHRKSIVSHRRIH